MRKEEMTVKERLLNAIKGKETDRVAWSPFLAYYFEHLPSEVQARGQFAYLKEMGADPLLRGFMTLYQIEYGGCEVSAKVCGNKRVVTYETPVGALKEGYTFSENANSWFLTEHPVKTEENFRILQYLYEHIKLKEDFKAYQALAKEVGEDGLIVPLMGAMDKTPFQTLVERWCGTVDLTYALYDFPEVVEECLSSMNQVAGRAAEISVNSEKTIKVPKKRNLPLNLKKDYLILLGIIFLLFINRHDCDENSEQEDTQDSKESMFSIERFKRILQIDKLSENDILLILMVYLLM